MSPHDRAVALANDTVGCGLGQLTTSQRETHRLIERWFGAYEGALAAQPEPEPDPTPAFLTVPEAAARLHCSESTVRDRIRRREIATVPRVGRRLYVTTASVDALLRTEEVPHARRR